MIVMNPARATVVASILLAALAVGPSQAASEFTTPILLENVTLAQGNAQFEAGTTVDILLDGVRITNIGPNVTAPPDARRVNGNGLLAYPGWIDAGVHLGLPESPRTEEERLREEDEQPDVSQAVMTATRFANRRGIYPTFAPSEVLRLKKKETETHNRNGFSHAVIVPRHGILSGTSELVTVSEKPLRRILLARQLSLHASFSPGEPGSYPRTLLGVMAHLRQVLLDAGHATRLAKHAARNPSTATPPPVDSSLDALQDALAGKQRIFFEADTEREIRRVFALGDEFGLRIGISGATEAFKVIDELKKRNVPIIASLKLPDRPYPEESKKGKKRKKKRNAHDEPARYEPARLQAERLRLWEEQVDNIPRLVDAGLNVSFRTKDCKDLGEFFKNLRTLIERGLPEESAVNCLTRNPATLAGMSDRLGSVERNHYANIMLYDKSIADKKCKLRHAFVMGNRVRLPDDDDASESPSAKEDNGESATDEPDQSPSESSPSADAGETNEETADDEDDSAAESKSPEESVSATDTKDADEPDETTSDDEGLEFAVEIDADRFDLPTTGGDLLIRNATILPVTSPTLENASILIRNGKIVAISEDIEAGPSVMTIDGEGLFVMPGFVDPHSHLGLDAVNEYGLAITSEVRIADVINPTNIGIYRALAGGTTTHHTMHGSANPVGGQNATLKLKYGMSAKDMLIKNAPATIKFATGENVTQANRCGAEGDRFPNTRMGVEDVFREAFTAGRAYAREWESYELANRQGVDAVPPRRDLRLEALSRVASGKLAIHAHCYRSDEILRLLAVAEEYGVRVGTLHHVLEGYRIMPEIARHGCGASTFSNLWAYKMEAYGAIPHNASMMLNAGICSSINSDSPNTIRYLGQEAAKSVRWGGLDTLDALKLVTINPAIQLQLDDRIGSLEIGKDGDLAIFNGHPLNTFSRNVMTVIDGEIFFKDDDTNPIEPCDTLRHPGDVNFAIPETVHRAYAVVGATIHPISTEPIRNGTVVIVGDRIHAVGDETTDIPPGAGRIDGKGLHVYPGLIDAGNSIGLEEIGSIRATRDARDSGTFMPQLSAAAALHTHSAHIRIARSAGTTTVLTKPRGGQIAGQSALIHLDGWTMPEMLIRDRCALHMSVPSLPVRLPTDAKRKKSRIERHEKTVRELDQFLENASHYAKVTAVDTEDERVSERIRSLEAMAPYVEGEKPVIFEANGVKEILDTVAFAEKHSFNCVISGGREAWKVADRLAAKDIPVILGTPVSLPRGSFEPWDSVYRCASVLDRAGVRFCFASESYAHAYDLGTMAGMTVAFGLPRQRAERAITLGAAEILGIDEQYGSLEPGKKADVIVMTDSPLQTASVLTHMFVSGKPVELSSLHTENRDKFAGRPDPDLKPIPDLKGPPDMTRR